MRAKRVRALRAEVRALLGRAPAKAGAYVPRYMGGGIQQIQKDEFRVYKKAYMKTRSVRKPSPRP